jgi:transcription termination factor Rho
LNSENATLATLRDIAKELNVPNAARLKKRENLHIRIRQMEAEREGFGSARWNPRDLNEGIGFSAYQLSGGLRGTSTFRKQAAPL